MKQVISNVHTLLIHAVLSTACMVAGMWATYQYGVAFNYGGFTGWAEAAGWLSLWSFLGGSVAGLVMLGFNDLFYWIQVHRHGYPHDNITDD